MLLRGIREWQGLRIDTGAWPITVMDFPERRVDDVALRDSLEYLAELLREAEQTNQKTFQITDLTRMREFAPASQRKYAAAWMMRTLTLQRASSLGGASVTPSAALRGLITAIHWIQPPPMPTFFVATRQDAFKIAVAAFKAAGVSLPAPIGALAEGEDSPALHVEK